MVWVNKVQIHAELTESVLSAAIVSAPQPEHKIAPIGRSDSKSVQQEPRQQHSSYGGCHVPGALSETFNNDYMVADV